MNQSGLTHNEIYQITNPQKRTNEEENRWIQAPSVKYLRHDASGEIIYEGDEIVDNTNQFQICQSCLKAFPTYAKNNICPHCGYDIDKEIEIRSKELELEDLIRVSRVGPAFDSYLHSMNVLAWGNLSQAF
jgi:hypothetical protein